MRSALGLQIMGLYKKEVIEESKGKVQLSGVIDESVKELRVRVLA